ncbi:hypothetical protein [Streptomyces chartreusis]|uniref:hypothetical protein n=1 Tax=Streptomyces chartreusis TaxID=1969 RepID=UPI0036B478E2
MTVTNHEKYRPPAEERWTDGMRTEPVRIAARTEWLYREYDPRVIVPEGRTRHAFSRSAKVTASAVPSPYESMQDLASHLYRAVAAFGDDKDLVIEVRLADDDKTRLLEEFFSQEFHISFDPTRSVIQSGEERTDR